jgi:hypothetical protein
VQYEEASRIESEEAVQSQNKNNQILDENLSESQIRMNQAAKMANMYAKFQNKSGSSGNNVTVIW